MAISATSDTMVECRAELIIKAAWDDIPVFNYTNLIHSTRLWVAVHVIGAIIYAYNTTHHKQWPRVISLSVKSKQWINSEPQTNLT
jgi:hypothetical protein